jgi:hypothetical protein
MERVVLGSYVVLDYLGRIGTGHCQLEEVRGLYMWNSGFMLVAFCNGTATEIIECKWNAPGSRELLSMFIGRKKCMWRIGLDKLCTANHINLPHEAYLGRGGSGVVFKAIFENKNCALKIMVADYSEKLRQEVEVISNHSLVRGAREHVVSLHSATVYSITNILDDTSTTEAVPVSGYLMDSVGTAAPKATAREKYNIFMSLVGLHRLDIVHGDARWANVIYVNSALRWIDFMNSHITKSHV